LIFLSEYAVLLYSCILITYLFFGYFIPHSTYLCPLFLTILGIGFSFIFIWVRITFCRFRYDLLIILAWKILLPVSLFFYVFLCFLF
jgi:NADH:ubiquinone oxidoreductase subunit H